MPFSNSLRDIYQQYAEAIAQPFGPPQQETLKVDSISKVKQMELSIRNDVLAPILGWSSIELRGRRGFGIQVQNEPRQDQFWYQRQQVKRFSTITFHDVAIAHYHGSTHTLEILHNDNKNITYAQKILDNQFCNYIPTLHTVHVDSCTVLANASSEAAGPAVRQPNIEIAQAFRRSQS
jgi:hypothetical protein